MPPPFPALAALIVIAACTPAGSRCPSSTASHELGTVDRLIAETRTTIDRGYVTERTGSGFSFCLGGGGDNVGVSFCNGLGGSRTMPIDRAAEQRKLDYLLQRRAVLGEQVAGEQALCTARNA